MEFRSEQWKVPNLVLNKELFNKLLEMELRRSLRYQSFTSLLLVGVASNGEGTENRHSQSILLEKMAQLLRKQLRETDIVSTFEGTVGVLLIQSDKHVARIVGDRLLSWVSNCYGSNEVAGQCSFNMGGACFPSHATDLKGLYQQAEEMLEMSKQRQGNLVCVSD
jgi:GGDEF domain-containing protein